MNIFGFLFSALSGVLANLTNGNAPFGRAALWTANYSYPNNYPSFAEYITLWRQGKVSKDFLYKKAVYDGYEKDKVDELIESQEKFLNLQDYVTLYRRGKMGYDELKKYFQAYNIKPSGVDHFLQSSEYFPSPQDLIRFAVREVYTKDTREYFGMDDDLPEEFLIQAQKAGLPENEARNYWASHWELPSVNMGYEMFHRGIIDKKELDLLLRSLDIMPFWREKLTQMSYNVVTRVDARRMYGMGVYTEDEVYKKYLEMGYSPDDAEALTKFTILYESDETKGLTKSSLVNAYKDDIISLNDMIDSLQQVGYAEKVINYTVESAKYEKTLDTVKRIKDDLLEAYIIGAIDIQDVRNKLQEYNLPTSYITRVINDVILQDAKRRKVPAKTDLLEWIDKGIITDVYFAERMRLIGYNDRDISLYLTSYAIDKNLETRKFLPVTTYTRWLKTGIIKQDVFIETLTEMDISEADINLLILENTPET